MIKNKIKILRDKFTKFKIDGYIVPKNDEYFSEYAKNDRFLLADPKDRYQTSGEFRHMKFSSMHGLSMSVLYFFLFKRMKLAVIPVLAVDYMFWGPLYSAGALNGIAWAMTV